MQADGLVFVICPLRDSSDHVTAADATQVHTQLATTFGHEHVGLLHGALPEAEKLALMERFSSAALRILVATTVVEVGIDVPAATLLIVLDADRFGLAQLHQLRGRIGRGSRAGRCLLYYRENKLDQKDEPEAAPVDALKRLQVLTENDDGMAIAEADLTLRGPGQLLGTGQHGLCNFRVASLPRDLDLLQAAHASVRQRLAAGDTMPVILPRLLTANDTTVLAGG